MDSFLHQHRPEVKDRKKIEKTLAKEYSAGFVTNVESETFPPGINEEIVTRLSKIKKILLKIQMRQLLTKK